MVRAGREDHARKHNCPPGHIVLLMCMVRVDMPEGSVVISYIHLFKSACQMQPCMAILHDIIIIIITSNEFPVYS